MNGKSAIMLILAVFSGLGAMYGTSQLLSKDQGPKPVEMQDIVVAVRTLKAEEVIKPEMVKLTKVPKEGVPAGSFESAKDLTDRSIQIPILAGEPVVDAKLSPKGTPAGLVSRIPVGMRAYAIEVNEQTGVSGFVLPGHRIDIVQNKNASGSGQPEAELILQNLLVLASGQTFTKPEDKSIMSRTITLAVTPPQVDTLVAARSKGPLTLSLRGVNDNEVVAIPDPPRPKPVPEPAPAPPAEVALKALEPLPEPPRPVQPKRRSLTIVHGLQGTERISLEEMEDAAVVGGEQP